MLTHLESESWILLDTPVSVAAVNITLMSIAALHDLILPVRVRLTVVSKLLNITPTNEVLETAALEPHLHHLLLLYVLKSNITS